MATVAFFGGTMKNFIECITHMNNKWDEFLKDALEKYDITYGEYTGIEALENKERLSSNILASRMNLSPSRASRVIENMVRKKVLTRDIDCTDRRKCTIQLTPDGIRIKDKIEQIKSEFEKQTMDKLSAEEVAMLTRSLEILFKVF